MGIYDWVTSLTGSWGPAILSAYQSNALWINGLAVLYGLVLLLSWQNADRMADVLVEQIVEQARKGGRKRFRLRGLHLSWEAALAHSRFPMLARQSELIPHRSTVENLRRAITDSQLVKRSARKLKSLGVELEE